MNDVCIYMQPNFLLKHKIIIIIKKFCFTFLFFFLSKTNSICIYMNKKQNIIIYIDLKL